MADKADDGYGLSLIEVATDRVVLEAHALTQPIADAPPAWSLDGRRVAFVGPLHLYVADLASGTAIQIVKPAYEADWGNGGVQHGYVPDWQGHQVALSRDGRRIAYLSNRLGVCVADLPAVP